MLNKVIEKQVHIEVKENQILTKIFNSRLFILFLLLATSLYLFWNKSTRCIN